MRKTLFFILLFFIIGKVNAIELTYSEWSEEYPEGINPILIESEDRYLWYKDEIYDEEYLIKEDIRDKQYDEKDYKYFESELLRERPEEYSERTIETEYKDIEYTENDIYGIYIGKVTYIDIYRVVIKDIYGNLISDSLTNMDENITIKFNQNYNINDLVVTIYYQSNLRRYKILTINLLSLDEIFIYFSNLTIVGELDTSLTLRKDNFTPDLTHRFLFYKYKDKLYRTYRVNRTYTTDYYTSYEDYTRDEDSLKTFYRYITNDYILVGPSGEIVTDESYCHKRLCRIIYMGNEEPVEEEKPAEEVIENPLTGDNIYIYFILAIISIILIIILSKNVIRKKYLVLSKRFINN